MNQNSIVIKGAREHNLKNVDLTIPRDKLIVFTGLSGSGKSSLAFDTIFADGQRRYMESLSSYARMFLGQMEKPDVDSIDGLSPAISIDQKNTSKNPRSTVGTVTEIYDYLRLLYARIGIPHCPVCGREIKQQSIDQIVDSVMALPEGTKIQLLAPIIRGRKGEHIKELDSARKSGFVRARVDGIIYDLSEEIKLDKNKKHTIEIIVDRLVVKPEIRSRLNDSLETVMLQSGGVAVVNVIDGEDMTFSQNYACPEHGTSIEELSPRMFSFNNPFGACPHCTGLGVFQHIDVDIIVPNKQLSIREGAIKASGWNTLTNDSVAMMYYNAISEEYNIPLDKPVSELTKDQLDIFLYGTGDHKLTLKRSDNATLHGEVQNAGRLYISSVGFLFGTDKRLEFKIIDSFGGGIRYGKFEGVVNNLERRYKDSNSSYSKNEIESYMSSSLCPECNGNRLKKESLSVTVGGLNISQLTELSVRDCCDFFDNLKLRL